MSVTPRDTVRLTVYETDGVTRLGWLVNARGVTWQEENNKPGTGTFEVPLTDATTALLTGRRIVRMTWFHGGVPIGRFAVRLQNEGTQLAVEGTQWLRFENQPGVLSVLGNAVVFPEAGLDVNSGDTRYQGFMSPDGAWYVGSDWVPPQGRRWADTRGGYRDRKPHEFRGFDPDARWISLYDPDASQPAGTRNYFRSSLFHLDEDTRTELLHACDGDLHLFIDGNLVTSTNTQGARGWETANRTPLHLAAGWHRICPAVKRGPTPGPLAFIASLRKLKPNGDPDGTPIFNTNTSYWLAHGDTPDPGWHRGQALWTLFGEANDRGVAGIIHVGLAFGNVRDTHGDEWTDRGQFAFPVANISLLEVARQLSESDMNVWMRPWSMRLCAARRRGVDRSATVELKLGKDGGALKSMQSTNHTARYNVLVGRHSDGSYVEAKDDDSVAGINRIEAGLSLASAGSDHTAERIMRHHLDLNATPKAQGTAEASVLVPSAPIPYLDYQVGDTIKIPGRRDNGPMKSRVLAISVDATGATVRAWPEFAEDTSA